MMRSVLLCSVGAAALTVVATTSSYAACVAAPGIDDNAFVNCTGTDTQGFNQDLNNDGSNLDNISLSVNFGATVTNANDTDEKVILVDDVLILTNLGTIESLAPGEEHAIEADKNADISNTGTIKATKDAIALGDDGYVRNNFGALIEGADEAITGEDGLYVQNLGTIRAGDKGIDTEGYDDLRVVNYGLIETDDKGIRAGADDNGDGGSNGRVDNRGTIISGDEAIELGDDGTVVVGDGASVTSTGDDAINTEERSTIMIGDGATVLSEGGDAIDVNSGTITNGLSTVETTAAGSAAIDVDAATAGLNVTNEGTLRGDFGILVEDGSTDPENDQAQIIDNSGVIEGLSGTSLFLWKGADSLTMRDGSSLLGDAQFGQDNDGVTFMGTQFTLSSGILFNGGDDTDTAQFSDLLLADFDQVLWDGASTFELSYSDPGASWSLSLQNWEVFKFGSETYNQSELAALASLAPVPLPAAGLLLAAGLGAMIRLNRRAKRRAA